MSFNEKVDQDNSDHCACTCNGYPPPVGFAANVVGDAFTYKDSDTYDSNPYGFRQAVEDLMFTSGKIGSAESTGKAGLAKNAQVPMTQYNTTVDYINENLTDDITWTLNDGVLIFTGTGRSIFPIIINNKINDLGIFSKNDNIKTVIIGPGIDDMEIYLDDSTSIKTVITIDNNTLLGSYNSNVANGIKGINPNNTVHINNAEEKKTFDCKNRNEAIAEIKKILATATLNNTAKAMIPAECGGTGPNPITEINPEPVDKTIVDNWAKADIETLWNIGIATYTKNTDLTKPTTRADFAYIAVKIYQKVTNKEPDMTVKHKFTDTDPHSIFINQAYNLGIISGVSETKFDPNGTLTREQAATMLARLATACGKTLPSATINPFTDTISTWAKPSVMSCRASNIMNGVSTNTFAPKDTYSTQQALVTMLRLYNYVKQ